MTSSIKPVALTLVLSTIAIAVYATDAAQFSTSRTLTDVERQAVMKPVSLVALIATPVKYANRIVAVRGYLHIQPEDERLYLSREDGEHLIKENALDVSFVEKNLLLEPLNREPLPKNMSHALYKFDKHYVLLIGSFSEGHLTKVSRVLEL
jgi:hypothetical protein